MKKITILYLCCLILSNLKGQVADVEFGKNRIQYHDFEWSFYTSDNFVTYFYLGGQDIGKFVIQVAEKNIEQIQKN